MDIYCGNLLDNEVPPTVCNFKFLYVFLKLRDANKSFLSHYSHKYLIFGALSAKK